MQFLTRRCLFCFLLSLIATKAWGQENKLKDRSQWADMDPKIRNWYAQQEMTDSANKRLGLGYKSCCDNGDVFKTRFRVGPPDEKGHPSDQWQYLDGQKWKTVPPDIVKEGDTPTGEPILFRRKMDGLELCFIVPKGGI